MNENVAITRKGRKFDQVLEGARTVFMEDGYEGASVDDISRAAGVSKATLYSYFPDKRLLFMEVTRNECQRHTEVQLDIPEDSSPDVVLSKVAEHMLSILLSDCGRQIFRICVAETERFPDLGRHFYESGPKVERAKLKSYFEDAVGKGELFIDDIDLAVDLWMGLVRSGVFPRVILNIVDEVSQADIDRLVRGAVEMFLARYGSPSA